MPIRIQGTPARTKQSTVFFGESDTGDLSELAVDLSHFLDDFAVGSFGLVDGTGERFEFSTPRTIGFRVVADSGSSGVLWHRQVSGNDERITIAAGGIVSFFINDTLASATTLPSVSGSANEYVIAWTSIPNPLATGPSDAVLHDVYLANVDAPAYDRHRFTFQAQVQLDARVFIGDEADSGTAVYTDEILRVWVERRQQSFTEIAIDEGLEVRSVVTGNAFRQHQGLPAETTLATYALGEYHGPALQHALRNFYSNRYRTFSPLWNERMRATPTIDEAWHEDNPFAALAPTPDTEDEPLRIVLGWTRVYPVPAPANRLWVRVHVRAIGTAMRVRVYSMNTRPFHPSPPEPPRAHYIEAAINRDDTASVGQYDIEGVVQIARGTTGVAVGKTYLVIAYSVDTSASASAGELEVNAVHVAPIIDLRFGSQPFGE